jgi:hypothetical protein
MSARLTAARRRFLADKNRRFVEAQPELRTLRRRLLRLGGAEVVLRPEPHLAVILARGKPWRRARPELWPGDVNGCHRNVARGYRDDPAALQIVTGWALHPGDVVWRQHSWLLRHDRLIETTELARIYYGAVLDPREAARFARSELGA